MRERGVRRQQASSGAERAGRALNPSGTASGARWPRPPPSGTARRTVRRNVLPAPGSDVAASSPPMIPASWREMARPRPVPP